MLVVRGVMLAEWSNSGTGSGLLRKGEIGIKRKARYLQKGREVKKGGTSRSDGEGARRELL